MDKINSLIKSFLDSSSLSGLTKYEQSLYQLSCDGEIAKLQGKKNKLREIEILLQRSNWGILVFKSPRASGYLKPNLEKILFDFLAEKQINFFQPYEIKKLTAQHIKVMYPGDARMPYWGNLESKLLNFPSYYYLIECLENKNIHRDIEVIKGWYKKDLSRNRKTESEGLRGIFRQLVTENEGFFEEIINGNETYEDSGIHAPCSITSRYMQLLGFMAIDANGRLWARKQLAWLNE